MKRILAGILTAFASLAAHASTGSLADVQVVSRSTGQRLPVYSHAGRLYVAGNPGERYAVQVTNRTGRRILTVVSVDGVNAVSGETAAHDQTGYVLAPWQSHDIAGWRKNAGEVAAFYFTALPDSYASRTGRPHNVGVIGIAVFREWTPPRPLPQPLPRPFEGRPAPGFDSGDAKRQESAGAAANAAESERSAATAPSAPAQAMRQDRLGTGHGEREHAPVSYTDFRRATPHPGEVISIHYDRYENLVARGIIPGAPSVGEPQPFPAGTRFVPDPPGAGRVDPRERRPAS